MIHVCDSTLRDGNHAVRQQLGRADIESYAREADAAGVSVVEVGHGNGLGASSLQVGRAALSDLDMLVAARASLHTARLGVLAIPGFATLDGHIRPALEAGVDTVRVGAHCTEADVTQQIVRFLANQRVDVGGVLLMTHMASAREILRQAALMVSYGAQYVVLMDSAGAYLPSDVSCKVGVLVKELGVPVGFHAHNNLGLAIANTLAAINAGAELVDVTARGFGAGAGNAPLELVAAVFERAGIESTLDWKRAVEAAEFAAYAIVPKPPQCDALTITSGLAGVFSGFVPHVERAAGQFSVDPVALLLDLGRRSVVAGQEDVIVKAALALAAVPEANI